MCDLVFLLINMILIIIDNDDNNKVEEYTANENPWHGIEVAERPWTSPHLCMLESAQVNYKLAVGSIQHIKILIRMVYIYFSHVHKFVDKCSHKKKN